MPCSVSKACMHTLMRGASRSYAATQGSTERRQFALKCVIEAWLLYSFSKYMLTGVTSMFGMHQLRQNDKREADWWEVRGKKGPRDDSVAFQAEAARVVEERFGHNAATLRFEDVVHVVAIPNYKEATATLRRTLTTLAAQRDARRALVVVLAMEARDLNALATSRALNAEFGTRFRGLYTTLHELRPGEVAGKSSNENWAVRCAKRQLVDVEGVDQSRIVVTVCDADTYFHTSYFAALTYAYVCEPPATRCRRFWQAATNFYPNSDEVPVLCSIRYALLSVGFLGQLANPIHYRLPFAVYSLALDLAQEAGYWDPAVIPEDWHMFLRCFYATGGAARVKPVFFPVGCECVTDAGALRTVAACYQQAKRWQWGAIDIGFIAVHSGDFGLRGAHQQLGVTLAASEHHLYYPLMWIVLAAAPWLVDDWATGWRFQLWASFYISNFFFLNILDANYRAILASGPEQGAGGPNARNLTIFSLKRTLAFGAYPLADLFLFVLPSLHAHARMALSTRFDYVVAPKLSICCASKRSAAYKTPCVDHIQLPDTITNVPFALAAPQAASYEALAVDDPTDDLYKTMA
ncbi:hypothetical protein CTAYLR_008375 [Chrysophaeum taylorii]|uniref:Glycosyltransferase 2-like domain-containing protein n=1 Tax=Chrysophaeum taylorii TaxID=2483200 RepID=A0AAD7XMJ1_9STRA|nr:hypothetical protein CTAYLR_008375 [Chrysophaeum taylorii]